MLSEELHEMFSRFSVSSNNRDNEIREIFGRFSASSNNRNNNYVER